MTRVNKHQAFVDKLTSSARKRLAGRRFDLSSEWRQEYATSLQIDRKQYVSAGMSSGSTAKAEEKVYTGTNLVGIATSHKSNLIPIFNTEDAKSVSSMRR